MGQKLTKSFVDNLIARRKRQIDDRNDGEVAQLQRKRFFDQDIPGFGCRINETGRAVFFFRYKINNATSFVTIGTYGEITPAQARDRAVSIRAMLLQGDDPKAKRTQLKTGKTVDAVIDRYLEEVVPGLAETTQRNARRHLEMLRTHWHNRAIGAITRGDVIKMFRDYSRTSPGQANQMLSQASMLFKLAKDWEYLKFSHPNPAEKIPKNKMSPRQRAVKVDEMPQLLGAVIAHPNRSTRDFILLALFTGIRDSKLRSLKWRDVNLDENYLIERQPKNRRGKNDSAIHHLSTLAADILRSRYNPANTYVFPAQKVGAETGHIGRQNNAWARIKKAAGIYEPEGYSLTIHDLRATLGTWMDLADVPLSESMLILGHRTTSAHMIYKRAANLERSHVHLERVNTLMAQTLLPPGEAGEAQEVSSNLKDLYQNADQNLLVLTRKDLYNLVWSKPRLQIAEAYGVSDQAVAKWCRRMGVPAPERGHWAKIQAGHEPPPRKPLGSLPHGCVGEITVRLEEKADAGA